MDYSRRIADNAIKIGFGCNWVALVWLGYIITGYGAPFPGSHTGLTGIEGRVNFIIIIAPCLAQTHVLVLLIMCLYVLGSWEGEFEQYLTTSGVPVIMPPFGVTESRLVVTKTGWPIAAVGWGYNYRAAKRLMRPSDGIPRPMPGSVVPARLGQWGTAYRPRI